MNERLDSDLAVKLRDFLKKKHIDRKRIVIDIGLESIELEVVGDLEDILNASPDFTADEAKIAVENSSLPRGVGVIDGIFA